MPTETWRSLLITCILTGCLLVTCASSEAVDILTDEEMVVPAGRYQAGVNMHHTCRVDFDSPSMKPELEWQLDPGLIEDVLLDGRDGIWFVDTTEGTPGLVRLNIDQSVDCKKDLDPDSVVGERISRIRGDSDYLFHTYTATPVIAMNGAVVIYIRSGAIVDRDQDDEENQESYLLAYLECVDLDGNTRWRSEPISCYVGSDYRAWRVSGNRIAMLAAEKTFNVYSLSSGEYLETVDVPGWSFVYNTGPIAMDDGGWIIHGAHDLEYTYATYPYIYRITADGELVWKAEYPVDTFGSNPSMDDNGIIVYGNAWGLRTIDSKDGTELWRRWGGNYRSCGITPDGNYAVAARAGDEAAFGLVDTNGETVWFVRTAPLTGEDDAAIYRDGNMLIGNKDGIILINENGEVIWRIEPEEYGVVEESRTWSWKLNPCSDGTIIAITRNPSPEGSGDSIFCFKAGE
jgi:hypothetical protein